MQHYYALDEKLAVFITPDPDPKHPHQVVYKTNFVFDFDLGKHEYPSNIFQVPKP